MAVVITTIDIDYIKKYTYLSLFSYHHDPVFIQILRFPILSMRTGQPGVSKHLIDAIPAQAEIHFLWGWPWDFSWVL